MVINDDLDVTDLFERLLAENYEVIKAYSEREVLEKLRQIKPDLLLINIMMPGINGLSLESRIKSMRGCKDIPVIMLTLKPNFSIIEKGIEHYIVMPVTRNDLINTVEGILKKAKVQELEAATALGGSRELFDTYESKVKQLVSNQRLLVHVRQILMDRKIEENEPQLNLIKSFERAIEKEMEAVKRLQIEIYNQTFFIK